MFEVSFGAYRAWLAEGRLPELEAEYRRRAALLEEFDVEKADGAGNACFAGIGLQDEWPRIVVAQQCVPAMKLGFHPGLLIVPETGVAFLGAGERLLAYTINTPQRIWEKFTAVGFWSWNQVDGVILMAAELELRAFDLNANEMWSCFVQPPWSFGIEEREIVLEVMGEITRFGIESGPEKK